MPPFLRPISTPIISTRELFEGAIIEPCVIPFAFRRLPHGYRLCYISLEPSPQILDLSMTDGCPTSLRRPADGGRSASESVSASCVCGALCSIDRLGDWNDGTWHANEGTGHQSLPRKSLELQKLTYIHARALNEHLTSIYPKTPNLPTNIIPTQIR